MNVGWNKKLKAPHVRASGPDARHAIARARARTYPTRTADPLGYGTRRDDASETRPDVTADRARDTPRPRVPGRPDGGDGDAARPGTADTPGPGGPTGLYDSAIRSDGCLIYILSLY